MIEGVQREQAADQVGGRASGSAVPVGRGFDVVLTAGVASSEVADRIPVSTMIDDGPGGTGMTLQLNATGGIICFCPSCGTGGPTMNGAAAIRATPPPTTQLPSPRSVLGRGTPVLDAADLKASLAAGFRLHAQRADFLASLDPISERS